jgi:hypothetical protein
MPSMLPAPGVWFGDCASASVLQKGVVVSIANSRSDLRMARCFSVSWSVSIALLPVRYRISMNQAGRTALRPVRAPKISSALRRTAEFRSRGAIVSRRRNFAMANLAILAISAARPRFAIWPECCFALLKMRCLGECTSE